MSLKHFFTGLGITTIVQIISILMVMWCFDPMRQHSGFVEVTMVAMVIFCITLFAAAKLIARSAMTKLYIQLIMLAVFLKMLLCVALIIGYQKGFHPADQTFVWPFLLIYLTSTIYEVIFLEKVGREKQASNT